MINSLRFFFLDKVSINSNKTGTNKTLILIIIFIKRIHLNVAIVSFNQYLVLPDPVLLIEKLL